MTRYHMKMTAKLSSITDLKPLRGWKNESNAFNIKLSCENCGNVGERFKRICKEETVQNGVHLIEKCSGCGRKGEVTILSQTGVPLKNGVETVVMVLCIEGLTPVEDEFDTEFYWTAKSQDTGISAIPFQIIPGLSTVVMAKHDSEGGDSQRTMGMVDSLSCSIKKP